MKGRTKISQVMAGLKTGGEITVAGWVRTKREGKDVAFINLNDGSTIKNLQVVANPSEFSELLDSINTGKNFGDFTSFSNPLTNNNVTSTSCTTMSVPPDISLTKSLIKFVFGRCHYRILNNKFN